MSLMVILGAAVIEEGPVVGGEGEAGDILLKVAGMAQGSVVWAEVHLSIYIPTMWQRLQ